MFEDDIKEHPCGCVDKYETYDDETYNDFERVRWCKAHLKEFTEWLQGLKKHDD